MLHRVLGLLIVFASCNANAGFFDGPELKSMADFKEGRFQFETKFSLSWHNAVHWKDVNDPYVPKLKTIVGRGKLFLPDERFGKVPALILIHASGGLYAPNGSERRSYPDWAATLNKAGIAVVLLDGYSPRSLGSMGGQVNRYNWDVAYDAFRVRALLRTHPRINADQIGMGGMSLGGTSSLFAYDQRVVNAWSDDGKPMAFYIAVYPTCTATYLNWQPVGSPLFFMNGALDEAAGVAQCQALEARLAALGAPVSSVTYQGAYHAWDADYAPLVVTGEHSLKDCVWKMWDGGGVRNAAGEFLDTPEKAEAHYRACASSDPKRLIMGRNDDAIRAGKVDMVAFIKRATDRTSNVAAAKRPAAAVSPGPASTAAGPSLEEQLERIQREQEEEAKQTGRMIN